MNRLQAAIMVAFIGVFVALTGAFVTAVETHGDLYDRCMQGPAPQGAAIDEQALQVSETSIWPLGLGCTWRAADGGTVTRTSNWTATVMVGGGLLLILGGAALALSSRVRPRT